MIGLQSYVLVLDCLLKHQVANVSKVLQILNTLSLSRNMKYLDVSVHTLLGLLGVATRLGFKDHQIFATFQPFIVQKVLQHIGESETRDTLLLTMQLFSQYRHGASLFQPLFETVLELGVI